MSVTLKLALILVLCGLPVSAMGQEPAAGVACRAIFPGEASASREMSGLTSCIRCHAAGAVIEDDPLARQFGISAEGGWINGNEFRVWGGEDRHSQAWATLQSEAAKRIGRVMGREGMIHRDVRCLACHSAFPVSQLESENLLVAESVIEKELRLTQGVSCEGCHGAAGDGLSNSGAEPLKGWLTAHMSSDQWRYLKAEDKCELGYWDVRSVATRTRICVSCHVGDTSMGRVLTHEMYAAGHPPLPPFELETFEDLMPRHWKDFSEKSEEVQRTFQAKSAAPMRPGELSRSRTTLIAGLATYAAFLRLTADLVEQRGFENRPELSGLGWPEFAQFDCYACHHDLRSVNWRQGVQAAGRPGRPRLTAWPAVLAGAASLTAGDAGQFSELERSLSAAVVRAPFGDVATLAADARRLAEQSDALADVLERGEWNPEQRQAAMARILDVCDGTIPTLADYDSARQYAWGFAVLYAESLQAGRGEVVQDLFGVNAEDGSGMSSRTGVPLLLDLKIGDRVSLAIPGADSREILQIDPGKVLPPIAGYDANAFRESFREIRKRLEENKK